MASQTYTPRVDPAPKVAPILSGAGKATSGGGSGSGSGAADGAAGAGGGDAPAGLRGDERKPDVFRDIQMRIGQHSQASGSAYIELGGTKVVCSLYGPRSYSRASTQFSEQCVLNFDVQFAPFACAGQRRERGQQADERELSLLLGQVLSATVRREKYPKSAVDVFVMVIEDDGGALGAAITAASLSFADAGIELYDVATACSVASHKGTLLLDPTASEAERCTATTTMAVMPALGEVTYAWHSGQMTVAQVTEAMSLCLDGCATLYTLARRRLIESATRKSHAAEADA